MDKKLITGKITQFCAELLVVLTVTLKGYKTEGSRFKEEEADRDAGLSVRLSLAFLWNAIKCRAGYVL